MEELASGFRELAFDWRKLLYSTDAPDYKEATEATKIIYKYMGLRTPRVAWCDSPMLAIRANAHDKLQLGKGAARSNSQHTRWSDLWSRAWLEFSQKLRANRSGWFDHKPAGQGLADILADILAPDLRPELYASNQIEAPDRVSVLVAVGDSVAMLKNVIARALSRRLFDDPVILRTVAGMILNKEYFWPVIIPVFSKHAGVADNELLKAIYSVYRHVGWVYPFYDVCYLVRHPTRIAGLDLVPVDDTIANLKKVGVLHSTDSAAIEFADGIKAYAVNGVEIPDWPIERPKELTPKRIMNIRNVELRRALISLYGPVRFVKNNRSTRVVHTLPSDYPVKGLRDARLLSMAMPGFAGPLTILELVNSTPEPDGTYKLYHLSINPAHYDWEASSHCHAAAASLYRHPTDHSRLVFERWQDYHPDVET